MQLKPMMKELEAIQKSLKTYKCLKIHQWEVYEKEATKKQTNNNRII